MASKESLLRKISQKPTPRDFTMRELVHLMSLCNCLIVETSSGSGIKFIHEKTGKVLTIHRPHPGNTLYIDIVKRVVKFLHSIGEL